MQIEIQIPKAVLFDVGPMSILWTKKVEILC